MLQFCGSIFVADTHSFIYLMAFVLYFGQCCNGTFPIGSAGNTGSQRCNIVCDGNNQAGQGNFGVGALKCVLFYQAVQIKRDPKTPTYSTFFIWIALYSWLLVIIIHHIELQICVMMQTVNSFPFLLFFYMIEPLLTLENGSNAVIPPHGTGSTPL